MLEHSSHKFKSLETAQSPKMLRDSDNQARRFLETLCDALRAYTSRPDSVQSAESLRRVRSTSPTPLAARSAAASTPASAARLTAVSAAALLRFNLSAVEARGRIVAYAERKSTRATRLTCARQGVGTRPRGD